MIHPNDGVGRERPKTRDVTARKVGLAAEKLLRLADVLFRPAFDVALFVEGKGADDFGGGAEDE